MSKLPMKHKVLIIIYKDLSYNRQNNKQFEEKYLKKLEKN